MGRINGANSDYYFDGNAVAERSPKPSLYLKIYICPDEQKNPLEAKDNYCIGTKDDCPVGSEGHAMLHLSEKEGVELIAGDNNRIIVHRNGDIELGKKNGTTSITIKKDGAIILDAATVTITGNLEVKGSYPGL